MTEPLGPFPELEFKAQFLSWTSLLLTTMYHIPRKVISEGPGIQRWEVGPLELVKLVYVGWAHLALTHIS